MNKSIYAIITIVVLISLITITSILFKEIGKNESDISTTAVATPSPNNIADSQYAAPDFTVYDRNNTPIKLSDFIGKPIVINFWTSNCSYCVKSMSALNNAYYNNPDIQFMIINVTDNKEDTFNSAKNFIDGTNFGFPVFYDLDLDASIKYGAATLPLTIFIDKNGELVTYFQGEITSANLERGLNEIR